MELFKPEDIDQLLIKPEFKKAEGIVTRKQKNLPPQENRIRELEQCLAAFSMDYMKVMYKYLYGKTTNLKKTEIITQIAKALTFSTVEQFESWFCTMPEFAQKILYEAAFTDYVPLTLLQKKWDAPLLIEKRESWRTEWRINPDLHLDFLSIHFSYGCLVTFLPGFLQPVLSLWLEAPSLFQLSSCQVQNQTGSWDISPMISDTFPLLCDALKDILAKKTNDELSKSIRNGFKKRDLNELRASTGFLPFHAPGNEYMPDSVDLAARFILCMCNYNPQRPKDGQEEIRSLIHAFFSRNTQFPREWYAPDRAYLEYSICIDHLNRSGGTYFNNDNELPAARHVFHDILKYIGRNGGWFDADMLAAHIRTTKKNFSFCDSHLENSFKLKADTLKFDDLIFKSSDEEFHPNIIMNHHLLVRPLFKAYCYFFAVLGLLEIVQTAPPLNRSYRNKQYPFSPYDSLKAIRITELGRWCLGLIIEAPPKPSHEYHAIADRELLLVTVQGSSLERQVYLDKIGRRLGEDRWRISPGSFIGGCTSKNEIFERIEKFKLLIDKNPAAHWEQLFKKTIDRSSLFSKNRSDILVYDLPENKEILDELLQDPEFRRIVRRVEGRMLALSSKDQKKFLALLNEHGIASL